MELPLPADLKKKRQELGFTQNELAMLAGVSQPMIAKIESGDVDPRLSTLRSIVDALNHAQTQRRSASDIMTKPVISVEPDDLLERALSIMEDEGFSQLPVIDNEVLVGSISERVILRIMASRGLEDISHLKVSMVMEEAFPTVSPGTEVSIISTMLDYSQAIIVTELGRVVGVITKFNVLRLMKDV